MAPLLFAAAAEHLKLAQDAGASELLRAGGWIKAYRSARGRELAEAEAEELKTFGVKPIASRSRRAQRARAACGR